MCWLFLDGSVDPYIMDEDDTAKCNALQSSLWEFKVGGRNTEIIIDYIA